MKSYWQRDLEYQHRPKRNISGLLAGLAVDLVLGAVAFGICYGAYMAVWFAALVLAGL